MATPKVPTTSTRKLSTAQATLIFLQKRGESIQKRKNGVQSKFSKLQAELARLEAAEKECERSLGAVARTACRVWCRNFADLFLAAFPPELRVMVYSYMTLPDQWVVSPGVERLASAPVFEPSLRSDDRHNRLDGVPYYLSVDHFGPQFVSEMAVIFLRHVRVRVRYQVDVSDFLARPLPQTTCVPRDYIREIEAEIALPGHTSFTSGRFCSIHIARAKVKTAGQLEDKLPEASYAQATKPLESIFDMQNLRQVRVDVQVHSKTTMIKFENALRPFTQRMEKDGIQVSVVANGSGRIPRDIQKCWQSSKSLKSVDAPASRLS
ncbi:hypothetical protein K491DRAFT_720157 [Lophiostoma macrostomum CBS 122681]|uniref:Uncharacterized protein n=1 Tax=Lophiostoma macrostomum CBS 122681 TaxID=1314788 RepID=A0A6A6SXZ1_9PLEO|nr:hypothetical protein K491DRAFT_720157 [Lophiostoma macrostomum CBS 122681]